MSLCFIFSSIVTLACLCYLTDSHHSFRQISEHTCIGTVWQVLHFMNFEVCFVRYLGLKHKYSIFVMLYLKQEMNRARQTRSTSYVLLILKGRRNLFIVTTIDNKTRKAKAEISNCLSAELSELQC